MLSLRDIRMCVADCMQDDVIENLDSILSMSNNLSECSWKTARGSSFTADEVRDALTWLMRAGHVKPAAEQPTNLGCCEPIEMGQFGTEFPWEAVWIHLEPSGFEAVHHWWESVGEAMYPIPE